MTPQTDVMIPERFLGLVATQRDHEVDRLLTTIDREQLPDSEVAVRVQWSSINYKDALAVSPDGKVAQISPLVPGIDLAGEVVEDLSGGLEPGQAVLVHGYGLGVSHHGGFAEYARVPPDWVVPIPSGLQARDAMILGTAGFTAALSVLGLENSGVAPDQGPVLVTGATGGVGCVAVKLLAQRGYEVWASTGKAGAEWLLDLGATGLLTREETSQPSTRPLERQRWAGCVDPVGGSTTGYAVRTTRYGGTVALSGLTGGNDVGLTVHPFILRGVSLLGIDSVQTPISLRQEVWRRLATDLRPRGIEELGVREIALSDVGGALESALASLGSGRTIVKVGE
ncbi:MAG TPA: acryloyl-CoA reductase [Solirubrobacteraceae bacterium]|nr:acryloyl-CoA reductase [Solirubrobacteraceae bacterium]